MEVFKLILVRCTSITTVATVALCNLLKHDDVIKWKYFPRNWPFVRGIHRSPVNSTHKGQWRGPLMFSLVCARINGWVNNGEAGDLRRYWVHCDVIVMISWLTFLELGSCLPWWISIRFVFGLEIWFETEINLFFRINSVEYDINMYIAASVGYTTMVMVPMYMSLP